MNRLCKNVLTRNSLARNIFLFAVKSEREIQTRCGLSSFRLANSQPFALRSITGLNNLNGISVRFNVTNTDKNTAQFKPERRENNFRGANPNDRERPFQKDSSSSLEEFEVEGNMPNESTGKATDYSSKETNGFASFDLPAPLLERLVKLGYNKPFEIQESTLKHTLAGKDLVGKAFTGSGKTLAFAIPIINKIYKSKNQNSRNPKCLVLSPTRELCLQLSSTIKELSPNLKCVSVYGGAGMREQISALEEKVDIVCATPGRLQDLINRKHFRTDQIEIICLDEADQLLNNNFLPQIEYLIEKTDQDKQLLMFSATINKNVIGLINDYMKNPVLVDLTKGKKFKLPTNIEHFVAKANRYSIPAITKHFVDTYNSERCIVFTNRKIEAANLSQDLKKLGIRSADLHSDITQFRREQILSKFRQGSIKIVCATDVAARGIDIPEIDLIIHVGPPQNGIDYYVHRSGRTGRAGREGKSIILDTGSDMSSMSDLSQVIKFKRIEVPNEVNNKSQSESDDENYNGFNRRSDNKFESRNNRFYGEENRSYRNSQFIRGREFNRSENHMENDFQPRSGGSRYKSFERKSNRNDDFE